MKILTENRDMRPLIHKFFSKPEIFWKTEGFLYNDFRFGPVRQKNSANRDAPPSYEWNFSIKEFFWNTTVFSNEFNWYRQTKTFQGKNVIPPIMKKKFDNPSFLKHWMGAHEVFRHCETWNFWRKNVIPPFHPQDFSKPEIFSKTVGFPHETFRHC